MKLLKLLVLFVLAALITACRPEAAPSNPSIDTKNIIPILSEAKIRADSITEVLMRTYMEYPATQAQKDNNAIIKFAVANEMELDRQESGLFHKIYSYNRGDSIRFGDAIRVQYTGYFLDGKILESSLLRGGPKSLNVGSSIEGWNEVLLKMRMGDKAKVVIPSHLAYGKTGDRENILPNTCLFFDLEIMGYVRDKQREMTKAFEEGEK